MLVVPSRKTICLKVYFTANCGTSICSHCCAASNTHVDWRLYSLRNDSKNSNYQMANALHSVACLAQGPSLCKLITEESRRECNLMETGSESGAW